jgi:hypothetical protein
MIRGHGSSYGPQHKIASQQKEEVSKCQQEARPLGAADINQVKKGLTLHNGD